MKTYMTNNHSRSEGGHRHQPDSGFSLLEMVVAMFILTIGLMGVASAVGYALMVRNHGYGVTNAKLLVVAALEQMSTLRDSGQLNFAEISNTQQLPPSVFEGFLPDFMPVSLLPGADFVYGTEDDPGYLAPTDQSKSAKGVQRQIVITDLSPTLKQIKVTLRYSPNGRTSPMPPGMCEQTVPYGDLTHGDRETRCLSCVSYLNDDAHGSYVP